MAEYRKKPIIIEAFKWTGDQDQEDPEWAVEAIKNRTIRIGQISPDDQTVALFIDTLEGIHMARQGDYIIKGIKGEIYPCKPDIFLATYEKV